MRPFRVNSCASPLSGEAQLLEPFPDHGTEAVVELRGLHGLAPDTGRVEDSVAAFTGAHEPRYVRGPVRQVFRAVGGRQHDGSLAPVTGMS